MPKFLLVHALFFNSVCSYSHGINEETKQAMIEGGYIKYIWLGGEHMITGYDHLLFLFGVIFFLTSFKDIVKFISVFTLGHSITLILATNMQITANYWLVDAVIALSVCYKGLDNNDRLKNYLGMEKPLNLLLMVFIFGLIHGFGLSTRLQQLPLGENADDMLMKIISFNIGVELGQIGALAVMLVLLSSARKASFFKRFSKIANDGLVLAGFLLFLLQLHGYLHNSSPDEFGFNKDNNIHHHEDIENSDEKLNQGDIEKLFKF